MFNKLYLQLIYIFCIFNFC